MKDKIELKFGNALEYARTFLDPPDEKHLSWRFGNVPIEADFDLSPESLKPFTIEILDKMAEIESLGICCVYIKIKNGVVKVI